MTNLKRLLSNPTGKAVLGVILTALLGLWINQLTDRRKSLSEFHGLLGTMQDGLTAADSSGTLELSLDTGKKLRSTIESELYTDPLSLGATTQM